MKMVTLEYRGFKDAIELSAGKTRLIVMPSWAGRVSLLDFGGGNVVWNDPKLDGKVLGPAEGWAPWDGNATDVVLGTGKDRKNQHKGLWLHPWKDFRATEGGVTLTSPVSKDANAQTSRQYKLAPDGKSVTYTYTVTAAGAPGEWTVWERCLRPATGYIIAPTTKGGSFPIGWAVRDETTSVPAEFANTVGEYLVVKGGTKEGMGIGAKLSRGWIAHVTDKGVFLVTYPLPADGKYPHYDGANVVFWLAPLNVEVEPISPTVALKDGETLAFPQVWTWLELPANVNRDDPQAVGKWLDTQAAASPVNAIKSVKQLGPLPAGKP